MQHPYFGSSAPCIFVPAGSVNSFRPNCCCRNPRKSFFFFRNTQSSLVDTNNNTALKVPKIHSDFNLKYNQNSSPVLYLQTCLHCIADTYWMTGYLQVLWCCLALSPQHVDFYFFNPYASHSEKCQFWFCIGNMASKRFPLDLTCLVSDAIDFG